MKNCFSMNFLGHEIILSKNNIQFIEDFGLVQAFFDVNEDYKGYLVGVVDHNFQEVVPLFPVTQLGKIEVFNYSILLSVDKGITQERYQMYQIEKRGENIVWIPLPFLDFVSINGDLAKIQIEQDGVIGEVLYNVSDKRIVSDFFHFIDVFNYNKYFDLVVAEAGYYLFLDENNFNEIKTYIDLKGKVVGPYLDCKQNKLYDSHGDFQEMIESIVEDMREDKKIR